MITRLRLLLVLVAVLQAATAVFAQNQMPDQRPVSHVLAGPGLTQKGRTLSLSVPVAASNGGAGNISGILKANGSGTVSAAVAGTDYAPASSGTSVLKGNGSGGFSSAVSGTDYAPPSSGTSILKGNGSGGFSAASPGSDYAPATSGFSILKGNGAGAFANAAPGIDFAPATTGNAILKGNNSGGFASASSGIDYAPPTSGSSILKGNGSGGFSNAVSGTDYQTPIAGNTLSAHFFANSISSLGALSGAQPGFGDLSGSLASTQMPALTGDTISSTGSTLTTTSKVNGVSYPSSPSIDTVPLITSTNTAIYKAISNCIDSGGNHLNYSTSTHTFSCGTTSNGGTPPFVTAMTALTGLSYGGL
jgi:hypothetical protein